MSEGRPLPLVAVLAAGLGTRFGGGKLDALCAGRMVGQWVLDALARAGLGAALQGGVIVTGPAAPRFAQAAQGWQLLANPDPARGLGSSLALAAREAAVRGRDLVVVLADMPLVDPAYLRWLAGQTGAAATLYPDGGIGAPARLPLEELRNFAQLAGDGGGARLLRGLKGLALGDPPADSLRDVDTPADLAEAARRLAARQGARPGAV